MAVTYQTEGVKMPDIKKRETTEWIKNVAASYGKRLGEIAYIFCSDEKILEVNRQYLQHDYYTDIITFDYCQGDRLSGDLFISLDTIRTNAEQFGAAYDDELHRVIIHGILHLCGCRHSLGDCSLYCARNLLLPLLSCPRTCCIYSWLSALSQSLPLPSP